MQAQMELRYYVTGLSFAQELGNAIRNGISTPFEPPTDAAQGTETMDISPVKGSFSDIRERRKLGKRILKAVQPYIETALQIEAEISSRPYDTLHNELEAIIEASVEAKQSATAEATNGASTEDVEMADATNETDDASGNVTGDHESDPMRVDGTEDAHDAPTDGDADGSQAAEDAPGDAS